MTPRDAMALQEVCITLRCDGRCGWCARCRGPDGPVFDPGDGGHDFSSQTPRRMRLAGGDPFRYGDLAGWVAWVRPRGGAVVEVEGPAASLTAPGVMERLRAASVDAVRVVVPALDGALVAAWTGATLDASALLDALDALRLGGLPVEVVVPVNALSAPHVGRTVAALWERLGPSLAVELRRAPRGPDEARAGDELDDLAASIASLADTPEGALRLDPDAGWGACLLPRAAWRDGLVPLSRTPQRDAPRVGPACEGCALAPRCTWRPRDGHPTGRMRSLARDEALALHTLSPHAPLEHRPSTQRTRKDRAAYGVPDLLCFAPFTSLVMCDPPNAPVPCAESWVRTEMTRDEQARALGVTREEIDQRHATSFARWGYRAFVPADEDWPIDAMWNGPLVRHMRAQMLRGGPSDRCRGNCRVMLGVEEPFFDALTHPDAELTPAVVANRRLLLEEINAGRDALTAKPLELVIGVASHCNISCGFCSGPMGSYGELTERRLDEVMAQLPTLMNLSVVGPGEPLMSKLFPKLLEHINDTGYPSLHVSMTTNGTLMTPSWLARHRNVRLGHIRISLNAGSAATHERMTGKRFFDRLMDNIDALAERKRQSDARFELTLSCVLSEYVLGDLMNFAEIVDRANANVVVEPMYGNALGLSPYVKADRLRALRDECRAVSDAFAVRNPKVARAFRAMEQFAQGRLQRRHLAVLPQH